MFLVNIWMIPSGWVWWVFFCHWGTNKSHKHDPRPFLFGNFSLVNLCLFFDKSLHITATHYTMKQLDRSADKERRDLFRVTSVGAKALCELWGTEPTVEAWSVFLKTGNAGKMSCSTICLCPLTMWVMKIIHAILLESLIAKTHVCVIGIYENPKKAPKLRKFPNSLNFHCKKVN